MFFGVVLVSLGVSTMSTDKDLYLPSKPGEVRSHHEHLWRPVSASYSHVKVFKLVCWGWNQNTGSHIFEHLEFRPGSRVNIFFSGFSPQAVDILLQKEDGSELSLSPGLQNWIQWLACGKLGIWLSSQDVFDRWRDRE